MTNAVTKSFPCTLGVACETTRTKNPEQPPSALQLQLALAITSFSFQSHLACPRPIGCSVYTPTTLPMLRVCRVSSPSYHELLFGPERRAGTSISHASLASLVVLRLLPDSCDRLRAASTDTFLLNPPRCR